MYVYNLACVIRQPLSQGRLIVQSPLTQLSSKLSTEENQVQHSGKIISASKSI